MDWTIHPDGGMWMGHARFVHVLFSTISRYMFTGMWRGYIAFNGKPGLFIGSMDFGEVITELERTTQILKFYAEAV